MALSALDELQLKYQQLSAKEKEIADYVIRHKNSIHNINIRDLSGLTQASMSTITRFCRKIGFASFVDFKISLNREADEPSGEQNFFARTQHIYNEIINATTELIRPEMIEEVVRLIRRAKRIYVYGLGNSGFSALEFKYRLMRMNILIDAVNDPHMMLMNASLMNEHDLVFGLSNSGRTEEVNAGLRQAKKLGATVVGITNFDRTPFTETTDLCLFTPALQRIGDVPFINSQLAIIYVLDMVSMLLLEDESLLEARRRTIDALYPPDKK
ncbi:MurR/RpiR family transcriptional regulator [Saccharibacillus sp. CPCC 101409]|uniref:MurR/RpiR family transcriptional regulator n=1 Tax=Saccharibacillus sp. CPCC 101409 TaxID=3058041 RepID=UPI002673324F|nr:MurR/RpiR family transcriptional regulator [Saccharibacillus sp. CPCC 101409]MDO3411978.1 MurR/RpiR family transcriptional regulator [Saccharibacillus sp. CPCC 101409]